MLLVIVGAASSLPGYAAAPTVPIPHATYQQLFPESFAWGELYGSK